jgi:hypothetical protein
MRLQERYLVQANLGGYATPPGLITGKAMGLPEKARKGNQGSAAAKASIIWRWMMAKQRAHKAVAAEAQASKDRQFKAFQKKLGLLSDKDGEELAPSTPEGCRRAPSGAISPTT